LHILTYASFFIDRDGNATYKFRSRNDFLKHYKEKGIKNIPSILLEKNHVLFNTKCVYKLKCCTVVLSNINKQGNVSKVPLLSKKSNKIQPSIRNNNATSKKKQKTIQKGNAGKNNLKSNGKRHKRTAGVKKDPVFNVEKIVNKRTHGRMTLYLIKWRGFDSNQNTWEPENKLIEDGLKFAIDNYNNKCKHQAGTMVNNNVGKDTRKKKQKLNNAIGFSPKSKKRKVMKTANSATTTSSSSSTGSINKIRIEKRFEKDGTILYYL
jgi:hypothetical protein